MFTQAMPAYIDALRQAVPASSVGPMAQALGNCAQPLTHRGGLNFAAPIRRNNNGTFGGGAWNPASYQNLFPGGDTHNSANYHNQVDLGGMNVTWNEGNRYDSQFYFPTNQVFTQNQFYGGPTVRITGGQDIDYISNEYLDGDTVNVQNLTTQVFNGDPVAGPQGPPGADGRDGQRGAPGAPGGFFNALPPGAFKTLKYLTGIRPQVQSIPVRVARPHRYIKDAWVMAGGSVSVPTNAISGGTVSLDPAPVEVTVPTEFTFNPDLCTIYASASTSFYAFPSLPSAQVVSGTPATTSSVWAATTGASTLASKTSGGGFLVKNLDKDFWADTATVEVVRVAELRGVTPTSRRVFHE